VPLPLGALVRPIGPDQFLVRMPLRSREAPQNIETSCFRWFCPFLGGSFGTFDGWLFHKHAFPCSVAFVLHFRGALPCSEALVLPCAGALPCTVAFVPCSFWGRWIRSLWIRSAWVRCVWIRHVWIRCVWVRSLWILSGSGLSGSHLCGSGLSGFRLSGSGLSGSLQSPLPRPPSHHPPRSPPPHSYPHLRVLRYMCIRIWREIENFRFKNSGLMLELTVMVGIRRSGTLRGESCPNSTSSLLHGAEILPNNLR